MSKIFIFFLIFALPSSAPSPFYKGAFSFHYSLRIGKMAKSFRRVYTSAPIEMQAKQKVVRFALGVEKGLRQDKCRLVKMSYLSRCKISKTGKYHGHDKIRKKQKNGGALIPSNLNFIKKMSELNQTRERLALCPTESTTIFRLLAARGFFNTFSLGSSYRWCSSTRSFITKQPSVIAHVKIKDYTGTFIIQKS